MSDTGRWIIAIAVVLLVLAMVAFARGTEHRRGDEVGALGNGVRIVTVA